MTWLDETRAEHRAVRTEVGDLRTEMRVGFASFETLIEKRSADLIKWSFVFWVGAVGAVAMLARVLGR